MATAENISIPGETIRAVRLLVTKQGGTESDVPAFVDQVLRREIFHRTAADVKQQNANVDPDQFEQEINKAVDWAREHRS